MFCPVCKYEFRRGFTHCNQCDADLVETLPAEEEIDHAPPPTAAQMDHPTLLWSGANSGIFSALTGALDEAGVPYNKEELDARLVFTSQHGDLEVWVPAANMAQAQPLLDSILANPLNAESAQPRSDFDEGTVDADNEIADERDEGDERADYRNENVARALYPEDATAEVWSGEDANVAEILKSCLAEIGVACYVQRPGSESDGDLAAAPEHANSSSENAKTYAIRVLPEDEGRAREIVQQVTTGAPPE